MRLILCSFLIATVSASAQDRVPYPNNREPLLKTEFVKLPLGAVKPRGWLRDELQVQADGLTGHLPEVWDAVKTTAWKGDAGRNVSPNFWACFVPRWLQGLVPLAYLLDDPRLKGMCYQYMGFILDVEKPETVTRSVNAWSDLGKVLPDYFDVTHDRRARKLARKILDYADSVKDSPDPIVVFPTRLGMLLSFGEWYYNQTGDKDIPGLLERCTKGCVDDYRDYFSNFESLDRTAAPDYPRDPEDRGRHGVYVTQAVGYMAPFYLLSKDEAYRSSLFQGLSSLDKFDGQVGGRWNADEWLAGHSPTQGTELCDVTELVYSLLKSFEALGDVSFADRLESLMFNAFPGTCTADMWAHQYDQQANQVRVSDDKRPWYGGNGDTANVYGFAPGFPCCLSNMHSPFPRYVEYMWMHTNDDGLVAAAYGPCEVKAKVAGGTEVVVSEETSYPFSDHVRFAVACARPAVFPIYLRIPGWADHAEVSVSGEASTRHPTKGSFLKIAREWKPGDVIDLSFHAEVRVEARPNNAVAIAWGPLYFALRIGESFKQIDILTEDRPAQPGHPTGVANWEIDPTTDWNYALDIDRNHPQCAIRFNDIGALPFAQKGEPVWLPGADRFRTWEDDVPLVIEMKAVKVARWGMKGANAGDVPASPVTATGEETTVELIPYGCTRLRISEFPTVGSR